MQQKTDRNNLIIKTAIKNKDISLQDLATQFNITRQRASQILKLAGIVKKFVPTQEWKDKKNKKTAKAVRRGTKRYWDNKKKENGKQQSKGCKNKK